MKMQRNYKDSIFRMLYLDKKELLSLYNAVNGTHYTDVNGLKINTLQMPIELAVERAITECIKEDILAEFLKKNRAEAMEVSIFEYNEELHLANLRREGYEDGLVDGMERGISQGITQGVQYLLLEILGDRGTISEELEAIILKQTDVKVLNEWVKIAAKCTKIEEFEEGLRGNL